VRPHELCKDRGVIAGAGADMDNAFVGLRIAGDKTERVKTRLAVIEETIRHQTNEYILVKNPRIIRHGVNVSEKNRGDFPRSGADVILARDGREGRDDFLICFAVLCNDGMRVEVSEILNRTHG